MVKRHSVSFNCKSWPPSLCYFSFIFCRCLVSQRCNLMFALRFNWSWARHASHAVPDAWFMVPRLFHTASVPPHVEWKNFGIMRLLQSGLPTVCGNLQVQIKIGHESCFNGQVLIHFFKPFVFFFFFLHGVDWNTKICEWF